MNPVKNGFLPLKQPLEQVKALKPGKDEVEEVVFQALASTERREILRIIHTREGGATYSEILGELALTTGNMNYHLKQLEGLLEKDEGRHYRLTPLGERAMSVLRGVDVPENLGDYVSAAKASQTISVHPFVSSLLWGAVVFTCFFLLVWGYLAYIAVTEGSPVFVYGVLAFLLVAGSLALVGLIRALRSAPEYVKRLERRLGLTR
jgi:predicted transcriptional regulator